MSKHPLRLLPFCKRKKKDDVPKAIMYAGTSPSGYVLKSYNSGSTWAVYHTSNYGNPTCFLKVGSNILYGTDEGYVVNMTKSTVSDQLSISTYIYDAIDLGEGQIETGADFGAYTSSDNGVTWDLHFFTGAQVNQLIYIDSIDRLIGFTSDGIFLSDAGEEAVQAGSFTCGLCVGDGVVYAGDTNDNIWKSEDNGETWADLGQILYDTANKLVLMDNGRIGVALIAGVFQYTDDNFENIETVVIDGLTDAVSLLYLGDGVALIGDATFGKIFKTEDNGATWSDLGQQYEESSINCFLKI